MENLIRNWSFEEPILDVPESHRCVVVTPAPDAQQSHYVSHRGEVNNPVGWFAWYVHDYGRPPAHDPSGRGWAEPEVRAAPHTGRQWDGAHGQLMFTFSRIHDGGFGQVVDVVPGHTYRLVAYSHAWASNGDAPFESQWVGGGKFIALEGESEHNEFTARVGVDLGGGDYPLSASVIWGQGAHIYNVYCQVPALEFTATGDTVTVFTRGRFLWPLKHCDQYWDGVILQDVTVTDQPPAEPPTPPPAEDVDYAYPISAYGPKLTGHFNGEGGGYDILHYLNERGEPLKWMKMYAPEAKDLWIRRAREINPTVNIIVRLGKGVDPGVNIEGPNLYDLAREPERYMASLKPILAKYADVKGLWWELWNESDPPGVAGHVQMALFALRCMEIADTWEFPVKFAHFSHSTGVPENGEWLGIWEQTPFFQRAKERGDILSLHAYGRTKKDIKHHLLRPTWLYENILVPNNVVVPFFYTEYGVDEENGGGIWDHPDFPDPASLMDEYSLADRLFGDLWYCLGVAVFTFGMGWTRYRHDRVWREFADTLLSLRDRQNALPPESTTDEGFDRYVMVVDYDRITDQAVRDALYAEAAARGIYVGPSHDEAANRPEEARSNTIELPGFSSADEAHIAFYAERDPDAILVFRSLPGQEVPATPSTRYPWDEDITEILPRRSDVEAFTHPSLAGRGWWRRRLDQIEALTIHHTNNWATWHDIARDHIQRDGGTESIHYTIGIDPDGIVSLMTPLDIDAETHPAPWHDHTGYESRHLGVALTGTLHVAPPTEAQLEALVRVCAWAIAEPRLPGITRETITGHMNWTVTQCPGWSAGASGHWKSRFLSMLEAALGEGHNPPKPPPSAPMLVGFNDYDGRQGTGLKWMVDHQLEGLIVRPMFIGCTPTPIDAREAEAAGVRVIANWRYSWDSTDNGGAGTLPAPGSVEWNRHLDALVASVRGSQGVWAHTFWNEVNNPREWPRDGELAPGDVARAYNYVRSRVRNLGVRMSPGALDPYHASRGDLRDWLAEIWGGIDGAELFAAHGYVRGPDPDLVGSEARFRDPPMQWQYLNFPLCVAAQLAWIPERYRSLPVYVTELNHIWRTSEAARDWGWVRDERAAEVTRRSVAAGRAAGFASLALYRWAGDAWALEENGAVLEAVKEAVR